MPHGLTRLAASAMVALTFAASSHAGIITNTGSAQLAEPPPSLSVGEWESNGHTRLFAERSGVMIHQPLAVDITAPGMYDDFGDLNRSQLMPGMVVDSYMLHQDAVGTKSNIMLHGSITFDTQILGLIVTTSRLNTSDSTFGLDSVEYPTGDEAYRGLDLAIAADRISISDDRRTITFRFETQTKLDQVRILTESTVPAPGALALLGCAGLLAGSRGRKA